MRLAFLFAMACMSVAQQTPTEFDVLNIPLRVELRRELSSTKARVGDVVELKYFGEIRTSAAGVVLNSKAKLYGRVTDAARRDKQQPEARLGIIVDRAEYKGKSLPLNAVFCGGFFTPPQFGYREPVGPGTPGKVMTITPGTSGLPEDVELRRSSDETIGTVLVSKKNNISISSTTGFYICRQRREGSTPSDIRRIVPPASLAPGVTVPVALKQGLEAATAKPGDVVAMTAVSDLIGDANTILIPKGADLTGKIIVAQPASRSSPSRLGILVERASWEGAVVPLKAFISHPPVLSAEMAAEMITRGKLPSVDLRQITLEKLSDGGTTLSRTKKNIGLPAGCVLMVRQSE